MKLIKQFTDNTDQYINLQFNIVYSNYRTYVTNERRTFSDGISSYLYTNMSAFNAFTYTQGESYVNESGNQSTTGTNRGT